eukprot:3312852-Pleurochrysis_carterae.AAC.5
MISKDNRRNGRRCARIKAFAAFMCVHNFSLAIALHDAARTVISRSQSRRNVTVDTPRKQRVRALVPEAPRRVPARPKGSGCKYRERSRRARRVWEGSAKSSPDDVRRALETRWDRRGRDLKVVNPDDLRVGKAAGPASNHGVLAGRGVMRPK